MPRERARLRARGEAQAIAPGNARDQTSRMIGQFGGKQLAMAGITPRRDFLPTKQLLHGFDQFGILEENQDRSTPVGGDISLPLSSGGWFGNASSSHKQLNQAAILV